MANDKRQHLAAGVVLALAVLVLLAIGARSWSAAIAAGGTGACAFVEWYQRARGVGMASWADLAAGALPSWVLAAAVHLDLLNLGRLGAIAS